MSPRVIPLPLSGGDRKNLNKELAKAKAAHAALSQRAKTSRVEGEKMLRSAQQKLQEADRLRCEAWNAIMFCGGPSVDSPTIAAAINGGFPLLLVCCNRCDAQRRVDLRKVQRPRDSDVHLMEAALFCESCSTGRRRQRAHILWLDREPETSKP